MNTWHIFGTQVEDQDQAQVERKGLKEDYKITHHFKSNIWSINKVISNGLIKKASNTQKRETFMQIQVYSSGILSCKQRSKMKQANHNKIVHLIYSGSQFIWVKNGIQFGIICLHQA